MDEAGIIELLVAGVAAIVVLAAGAEGIRGGGAEVYLGARIPALAPSVKGLPLGGGIGEGGAIPGAGVNDIGGAEVVFEDGGELNESGTRCDGASVNTQPWEGVAVKCFDIIWGSISLD